MVERFHIFMFCLIIAARNMIEVSSGGHLDFQFAFDTICLPLVITYASEVFVDWLKHSFITKFNGIVPDVYKSFLDILCQDYARYYHASQRNLHTIPLRTASLARKIGFSPLPMACLLLRISLHTYHATQVHISASDLLFYGTLIYLRQAS
jgi:Eukaryotic membrane protein family